METFTANGQDALGGPRELTAKVDLPMIVSVGASYAGCEDWLLALDVRYFDFANTDGFGDPATFDGTRLRGIDQSNVMAVAVGAQRHVSDRLTVRGGYSFNQNPTKNSEAFYNVATPLIYQHILSTGASLNCTECLSVNLAYSYYFENTRSGQIQLPSGAVPTSTFDNKLDAHLVSFGLTIRQ